MRKLFLFIALLLLNSPAFAANYTDVWSDFTNVWSQSVTEPTGVMFGSGNIYQNAHTSYATTTLRSPLGRTSSVTVHPTGPAFPAIASTIMPLNGEIGEWTANGSHSIYCTLIGGFIPASPTGPARIQIGFSHYCVKVVLGTCVTNGSMMTCSYEAVTPCNCYCPISKSGYSTISTYGVLQMTYIFKYWFTRNPQTGSFYCGPYSPLTDPACSTCWDQVAIQI